MLGARTTDDFHLDVRICSYLRLQRLCVRKSVKTILLIRQTLLIIGARSPANDCRINCKTAPHGDGDRGTPVAPYVEWQRERRAAVERGLP